MENPREKVDLLIKALYNKMDDMCKYELVKNKTYGNQSGLTFPFGIGGVFISTAVPGAFARTWSRILSDFDNSIVEYEKSLFEKHLTIKDVCVWIEVVNEEHYQDLNKQLQTCYTLNAAFCIRCYDPLEQWGKWGK